MVLDVGVREGVGEGDDSEDEVCTCVDGEAEGEEKGPAVEELESVGNGVTTPIFRSRSE